MRVGIFSPTMYRIGGAELVAVNMVNALKQNGYNVIVSSNKKIDKMKIKKFYGKNLEVDAQTVFPLHFFPAYHYNNTYTLALQSYILKLKCDILIDTYGISPFPWCDITYFQGSRILEKPSSLGASNTLLLPYFKLLKSFGSLNKKVVLANSEFKAKILEEYLRKKERVEHARIEVLYPPAATDFFSPSTSDLNKPRSNAIITVSRISPSKGLEIIPHIAQLTPKDISFTIAGSCYSKETMYSILRSAKKLGVFKRLKIFADVSRVELRNLLWDSKVYLHAMRNEAFGIAIIEGMASGCTPIVHNSGGPAEFVSESLRYDNVAEAAAKIEQAISDWTPESAQRTSKATSRFSEKEFARTFINVVNTYTRNLQA